MNIYTLIGLIIALAVLLIGLLLSSTNLQMFLDYPSLFIVLGGTFAAVSLSFSINRIGHLIKIYLDRVLRGKRIEYAQLITEMVQILENYRKGSSLEDLAKNCQEPFLSEALLVASNKVMDREELIDTLEIRVINMNYYNSEEASKFKSIGKFPPAFGMMGTTIGMIVLLSNLGGKDAIKMIGPSMSLCLITTLYGVIVANLGILPAAEHLSVNSKEVNLKNIVIVEGIKLILEKKNPIIVVEKLNSYLPTEKRLDWKQVIGK